MKLSSLAVALLFAAPSVLALNVGVAPVASAAPTGRLPVVFEENLGQAAQEARFVARTGDAILFVTTTGVVHALIPPPGEIDPQSSAPLATLVRMTFEGGRPVEPVGEAPTGGASHHLVGADSSKWVRNARHFAIVTQEGVYDRIDVRYHDDEEGRPEFDFIVKPGADATSPRLAFEGADRARIARDGSLVLEAGDRQLRLAAPVAYQEGPAGRFVVDASFELVSDLGVGFRLGPYDASRPLVIDPVIGSSTYFGNDFASLSNVATAADGRIVVGGYTYSDSVPADSTQHVGASLSLDAFVAVLAPDALRVERVTYVGGSGLDYGTFALAASGETILAGMTTSANFPLVSPVQSAKAAGADLFVARLSADGTSLVHSTFLGGLAHDSMQTRHAIAIDSANNVAIVGSTRSPDMPTLDTIMPFGGGADAYLAVFNPAGALLRATTLGGPADDEGLGILVDASDRLTLVGFTSALLPGAAPPQAAPSGVDAFVMQLSARAESVERTTYWGGAGRESANDLAFSTDGGILIVGSTTSYDFPVANASQPDYRGADCVNAGEAGACSDGFVLKLDADWRVAFATRVGGGGVDDALGVAAAPGGEAWVVGETRSQDLPLVRPVQDFLNGISDVFVARVGASSMPFSTYFGGDWYDYVDAAAATPDGGVIVTGSVLWGDDVPTTGTIENHTGREAFIFRVRDEGLDQPSPPRSLTGHVLGVGAVELSWEQPTFTSGLAVEKYRVYLARGAAVQFVGETVDKSFKHIFAEQAATWTTTADYRYHVSAVTSAGESLWSQRISCWAFGAWHEVAGRVGDCVAPTPYVDYFGEGPLIASGEIDGGGYAALRFASNGAGFSGSVLSWSPVGSIARGVMLYNASGGLEYSYVDAFAAGEAGTTANADAPGASVSIENTAILRYGCSNICGGTGIGVYFRVVDPGVYTLVVWSVGRSAGVEYELHGGRGITPLAFERGREAFLYQARDFEGDANVVAEPFGVGGRAEVDTSVERVVQHAFFGLFQSSPTDLATIETPNGESLTCPCAVYEPREAGNYRFTLTGAAESNALLAGVDVRMP